MERWRFCRDQGVARRTVILRDGAVVGQSLNDLRQSLRQQAEDRLRYRVVDARSEFIAPSEHIVNADSPEDAAFLVLGLLLQRLGKVNDIAARVYELDLDSRPTLTRLYLRNLAVPGQGMGNGR